MSEGFPSIEEKLVTSRKPKPSLKTALDYLEKGIYSVHSSDYVSPEDRVQKVEEFKAEAENLLRKHLPRGYNLTLVLLKCHIVLEFMLNKFIELVASCEVDMSKRKFGFFQKIELLHLLGFPPDPTVIPSLELLNTLRNQVAHTLELDRGKVDLLIKINGGDPQEVSSLDDKARASWIRAITAGISGNIVGCVQAHNIWASREAKDADKEE